MSQDLIAPIIAKVERAKEHIRDLETAISQFLCRNIYTVIVNPDLKTGEAVGKLRILEEPPLRLAAISGDIIQSLRASLDYLAVQLVVSNGGSISREIAFPIFNGVEKVEARLPRKIKGASNEVMRLMRELKPYQGGNPALWNLHRLSTADKHRFLITTGVAYGDFFVDTGMRGITKISSPIPQFEGFMTVDRGVVQLNVGPKQRIFPLKDGMELFRGKGFIPYSPHLDQNPKLTFDIAFGEKEMFERESLVPTFKQLLDMVNSVIESFRPELG